MKSSICSGGTVRPDGALKAIHQPAMTTRLLSVSTPPRWRKYSRSQAEVK
jgi:hypothetical protein